MFYIENSDSLTIEDMFARLKLRAELALSAIDALADANTKTLLALTANTKMMVLDVAALRSMLEECQ